MFVIIICFWKNFFYNNLCFHKLKCGHTDISHKEILESPLFALIRVVRRGIVPTRGSVNAAGYDLYSCATTIIQPQSISKISTGLRMEIPLCFYGQIKSRSSTAFFCQLEVVAGVIDSDFRGIISILIHNISSNVIVINMNEKIAQTVFLPCIFPMFVESSLLSPTIRDEGSFGSTNSKTWSKGFFRFFTVNFFFF